MNCLHPGRFGFELAMRETLTLADAMRQAQKYIQASEICKNVHDKGSSKRKTETSNPKDVMSDRLKRHRPSNDNHYPHFNLNRREIYLELDEKSILRRPIPIKTSSYRRDKKLWCEYPRECSHTTKDCKELKKSLDKLANKGKLNRYLERPKRRALK